MSGLFFIRANTSLQIVAAHMDYGDAIAEFDRLRQWDGSQRRYEIYECDVNCLSYAKHAGYSWLNPDEREFAVKRYPNGLWESLKECLDRSGLVVATDDDEPFDGS